jgi:hypothetical protein
MFLHLLPSFAAQRTTLLKILQLTCGCIPAGLGSNDLWLHVEPSTSEIA